MNSKTNDQERPERLPDVQGGEALSGSTGGSTLAGSLEGGSAPGDEENDAEESARPDAVLGHDAPMAGAIGPGEAGLGAGAAPQGQGARQEDRSFQSGTAAQGAVNNTGQPLLGPKGDPAEGKRADDDADAATG